MDREAVLQRDRLRLFCGIKASARFNRALNLFRNSSTVLR